MDQGMQGGTQSGLQNMADTAQQWFQQGAVDPITAAWWDIVGSFPSILGALLILLIGVFIAKTVEQLLGKGLKRIGLDKLADQIAQSWEVNLYINIQFFWGWKPFVCDEFIIT